MLRSLVRRTLIEQKLRRKLSKILYMCIFVGFVFFFSGPFYAQEVFTSENALRGNYLSSEFENDRNVTKTFNRFKEEVEQLNTTKNMHAHRDYVKQELGKRAEVYTQQLASVGMRQKYNVYAYFRSKDGYGQECNFIAAPLEYKAGITYILTFLDTLKNRQPHW